MEAALAERRCHRAEATALLLLRGAALGASWQNGVVAPEVDLKGMKAGSGGLPIIDWSGDRRHNNSNSTATGCPKLVAS